MRQRSEDIRTLSEVNKMNDDIKKYQEKWMPDSMLPRRVFKYRPRRKRDLERPGMRWSEQFVKPRNGYNRPKTLKAKEPNEGYVCQFSGSGKIPTERFNF